MGKLLSITTTWTGEPIEPKPVVEVKVPKRKKVSEAEFKAFLAAYPRKLETDVAAMYEPPLVTFNDFTLGVWPESIVASHSFTDYDARVPADWDILDGEQK